MWSERIVVQRFEICFWECRHDDCWRIWWDKQIMKRRIKRSIYTLTISIECHLNGEFVNGVLPFFIPVALVPDCWWWNSVEETWSLFFFFFGKCGEIVNARERGSNFGTENQKQWLQWIWWFWHIEYKRI